MVDQSDLRKRLERLGLTRARQTQPSKPQPTRRQPLEALPGAHIEETAAGEVLVIRERLAVSAHHGEYPLGTWLEQSPETVAQVGSLPVKTLEQFVFLDTETTGLGGGAFAFEVGVGFFDGDEFEVRQYFLRDPSEEAAMLTLLNDLLPDDGALVTFNGRTFDVPLLQGRFIMNRMPPPFQSLPNLDLLHPSRRLWSRRLASCALGALEKDILGLQRTQDDVPGSLIPWLYQNYLQTGDPKDMYRVLYHNRVDLLSMVTLASVLCRSFERVRPLHDDDALSLARWYERQGMATQAEQAYRTALETASDEEVIYDTLFHFSAFLKRADRRADAVPLWENLADFRRDVSAHEELAKFYEWHVVDLGAALAWTEAGLTLIEGWRRGPRHRKASNRLEHRRQRLARKLESRSEQHETHSPLDRDLPPDNGAADARAD